MHQAFHSRASRYDRWISSFENITIIAPFPWEIPNTVQQLTFKEIIYRTRFLWYYTRCIVISIRFVKYLFYHAAWFTQCVSSHFFSSNNVFIWILILEFWSEYIAYITSFQFISISYTTEYSLNGTCVFLWCHELVN